MGLDGHVAYEHRTPAWAAPLQAARTLTPSCQRLMQSLDEFIEHNKERLMAEKPIRLEPSRCSYTGYPVNGHESYKQAWLGWWRDTGQALAQPGDLARLATLWTIVSLLDRGNLPGTLDQSRLNELSFYNLYDIFLPQMSEPTSPR